MAGAEGGAVTIGVDFGSVTAGAVRGAVVAGAEGGAVVAGADRGVVISGRSGLTLDRGVVKYFGGVTGEMPPVERLYWGRGMRIGKGRTVVPVICTAVLRLRAGRFWANATGVRFSAMMRARGGPCTGMGGRRIGR